MFSSNRNLNKIYDKEHTVPCFLSVLDNYSYDGKTICLLSIENASILFDSCQNKIRTTSMLCTTTRTYSIKIFNDEYDEKNDKLKLMIENVCHLIDVDSIELKCRINDKYEYTMFELLS